MKKLNYTKISLALCTMVLSLAVFSFVTQGTALAEPKCAILAQGLTACPTSADGKTSLGAGGSLCYYYDPGDPKAGTDTNFPGWRETSCTGEVYKANSQVSPELRAIKDKALKCSDCTFTDTINNFINFLSALVGVVAVLSIVVGAIQYGSSQDDPQKVNAAKSRITATVIAVVSYFLLYAFLQWLIPGGILNEL